MEWGVFWIVGTEDGDLGYFGLWGLKMEIWRWNVHGDGNSL